MKKIIGTSSNKKFVISSDGSSLEAVPEVTLVLTDTVCKEFKDGAFYEEQRLESIQFSAGIDDLLHLSAWCSNLANELEEVVKNNKLGI